MVRGMPKRDYYEALGVPRNVGEADLKSAYRRLARQYHPDHHPDNPTAEEKFKEAAEAYSVLSKPEARRRYDLFGHPNASIDDAVRDAWTATRSGGRNYGNGTDEFIHNIYERWSPQSAWEAAASAHMQAGVNADRKYGTAASVAILATTAVGYMYGRANGLDVAPFNWIWPAHELESFRNMAMEDPQAAKTIGGLMGGGTAFVVTFMTYGTAMAATSIHKAVNAFSNFRKRNPPR